MVDLGIDKEIIEKMESGNAKEKVEAMKSMIDDI